MPPKKAAVAEKSTDGCILQYGQENNSVEWREETYNLTTGLYGTTGMFFHLNRSYKHPLPQLKDYHPAYVAPVVAANPVADADDDEDYVSQNE